MPGSTRMHTRLRMQEGRHRWPLLALVLTAALALTGCKTTKQAASTDITTGSITQAGEAPSLRDTMKLQEAWKKRPGDPNIGLPLARNLKGLGQRQQQLEVLKTLVEYNPGRQDIRHLYAVELLKASRPVQAEEQFRRLLAEGRRDWRTFNGLGSALAAQNRHDEARRNYQLALKLSPGNPKVMNNLAMSHILAGDPARAEQLLRQALGSARGSIVARLRQNLALALGLQGRFREARYVASHELPPAQVEANMAYLRKMLGSGQTWDRIANADASTQQGAAPSPAGPIPLQRRQ